MKKFLPLMVLFGLISFSCSKVAVIEEPQVDEDGFYTFVLNANVDQDLTRTEYGKDEVSFSWSKNDEISVLFHKGETHKFFTLKTTKGGSATAEFTGKVESGFTLGASDTEGGLSWALFPASDQHSWNTETHLPDFYEAPETDYTQSHFSANLPMYANGDEKGNFTFKYLTSCYKFVFTDVNASKVKFLVHSVGSAGWYLSGKSPVKADGSSYYLQCYDGDGSRDITFIEAVGSDKKAVFYVPFRGWEAFTPEITLVSLDTDSELLHATAKTALNAAPFGRIVVLPAKSLSDVFIPDIGINGDMSDWADKPVGEGSSSRILEWRYASDKENVYFMYKVDKSLISFNSGSYNWGSYIFVGFDNDNDDNTPGAVNIGSGITGGYEAMASVYPWRGNVEGSPECYMGEEKQGSIQCPFGTETGHVTVAGTVDGNYSYIEVCIPRELIGSPSGEITVNHSMNWEVIGNSVITLAGPAEPKQAVINAEDVSVKVGKSVNIGATTNSTAAIKYTSSKTSIAKVSSDGTVTGVAVGSTTIKLSVPAVEGKYTAASKTIKVTVSEASTAVVDIDGDMSDWDSITPTYESEANSRIREWKYVSDSENLYFYFVMRKNRSYNAPLCIGFDWDDSGTYTDNNKMGDCELIVKGRPFTNASGAQPVCVKGYDPQGEINGAADAAALFAWDYDDGSSVSDNASNHYLEVSIPRSKLTNLPAAGTTVKIGVSFDYYFAGFQSITLQ